MCFLNSICGDETEVLLEKKNLCSYGMVLPKNIPMVFVGCCGEITMPHPTKIYIPSHRYQGWPEIPMVNSLLFVALERLARDTTIPISLLLGLLMGLVLRRLKGMNFPWLGVIFKMYWSITMSSIITVESLIPMVDSQLMLNPIFDPYSQFKYFYILYIPISYPSSKINYNGQDSHIPILHP